jgi:type I restriction enzyme S subunit
MSSMLVEPRTGELGEIADVIMGQSPVGSSYNRDGVGAPLINGPTEFTAVHPVPKQWTTAPVRLCRQYDVLICVRGSSTGRMNVADTSYCIGRGVAAVRASGRNDQTYVQYALAAVVADLLKLQTGSTFPSIDSRVIRGGTIRILDPQEQLRVADVNGHSMSRVIRHA